MISQLALDRLVAVGDAADRDHLAAPTSAPTAPSRSSSGASSFTRILRLEVEAGGEAEVLVRRARVAVDAAVLAAAVRVDAGVEADVRAVVGRDDAARVIAEELGLDGAVARVLVGDGVEVGFRLDVDVQPIEAVGRLRARAAALRRVPGLPSSPCGHPKPRAKKRQIIVSTAAAVDAPDRAGAPTGAGEGAATHRFSGGRMRSGRIAAIVAASSSPSFTSPRRNVPTTHRRRAPKTSEDKLVYADFEGRRQGASALAAEPSA